MNPANPKPTVVSPAPELARRALSPDRWAILCRHFASLQREHGLEGPFVKVQVDRAIEIEGVTFLPAVYYPA